MHASKVHMPAMDCKNSGFSQMLEVKPLNSVWSAVALNKVNAATTEMTTQMNMNASAKRPPTFHQRPKSTSSVGFNNVKNNATKIQAMLAYISELKHCVT